MTIIDAISSGQLWLTFFGVMGLVQLFKKRVLGAAAEHVIFQRLVLPLAPVALGAAIGVIPGWYPGDTVQIRVVTGAMFCAAAPMFYAIFMREGSLKNLIVSAIKSLIVNGVAAKLGRDKPTQDDPPEPPST